MSPTQSETNHGEDGVRESQTEKYSKKEWAHAGPNPESH